MRVITQAQRVDTDGVWTRYPGTDAEFLIARAGNSRFLSAVDKYERPFRKQRNRGTISSEREIEIQCRAMADGILMGWKGLKTEDGDDLEYTADNAYSVLRFNSDVREFVSDYATDQANYRQEDLDETAKK